MKLKMAFRKSRNPFTRSRSIAEDSESTASSSSDGLLSNEFAVSFNYSRSLSFAFGDIPDRLRPGLVKNDELESSLSFHCVTGAAMSANLTMANSKRFKNYNVLDAPEKFVPVTDYLSFRRTGSVRNTGSFDADKSRIKLPGLFSSRSFNAPLTLKFLGRIESESCEGAASEELMAGGPAGEDRVQAIYSEKDRWLYCGVYDGFNGRDAADYVAANLYKSIAEELRILKLKDITESSDQFKASLIQVLRLSIGKLDAGFFQFVEEEMKEAEDLPLVGCCIAFALLYGDKLLTVNLGDSKVVLGSEVGPERKMVAKQLTVDHSARNAVEIQRLNSEHPGEEILRNNRVKGKLAITRAIGAGFLKEAKFNDALPGMFRAKNFISPPYISTEPHISCHQIKPEDRFLIMGSDGLFDHFTNEELVSMVNNFQKAHPGNDVAKFLIYECLGRVATREGMSVEKLKSIPCGSERRRLHDDISVAVIFLKDSLQMPCSSGS